MFLFGIGLGACFTRGQIAETSDKEMSDAEVFGWPGAVGTANPIL